MRILLTGATGYVGKRLLPLLLEQGHHVVCAVRDEARFALPPLRREQITVVEVDFLDPSSLAKIRALPPTPSDPREASLDVAFYLIHSMAGPDPDFAALEARSAANFRDRMTELSVKQVVYLGGISNADELSRHLASRQQVELTLAQGGYALTALRAGIIIGSGSASFEIMRDLVEKLPVMITPRWLNTRSQPIAVRNVLEYLLRVIDQPYAMGRAFDLGGPEVLTYREMLLRFARLRGLRRAIWTVPVMTPRLSSYWLYFVTATSYALAVHLVNSMKVEVVAKPNDLARVLGIELLSFDAAIGRAFARLEQNEFVSSWKDAMATGGLQRPLKHYLEVPHFGCFTDVRELPVADPKLTLERIWSIGGATGWYYGNFLWKIRGALDKLIGGVGLRRGRTHPRELHAGDALDFWRVLLADKDGKRLLLYAEMRLPGEAWLEFRLDSDNKLHQSATFRPRGLLGRLYWYAVLPLHFFVFQGLLRRLAEGERPPLSADRTS
jgi:uncharacterized protein YbjT (DUF2867 family)